MGEFPTDNFQRKLVCHDVFKCLTECESERLPRGGGSRATLPSALPHTLGPWVVVVWPETTYRTLDQKLQIDKYHMPSFPRNFPTSLSIKERLALWYVLFSCLYWAVRFDQNTGTDSNLITVRNFWPLIDHHLNFVDTLRKKTLFEIMPESVKILLCFCWAHSNLDGPFQI